MIDSIELRRIMFRHSTGDTGEYHIMNVIELTRELEYVKDTHVEGTAKTDKVADLVACIIWHKQCLTRED